MKISSSSTEALPRLQCPSVLLNSSSGGTVPVFLSSKAAPLHSKTAAGRLCFSSSLHLRLWTVLELLGSSSSWPSAVKNGLLDPGRVRAVIGFGEVSDWLFPFFDAVSPALAHGSPVFLQPANASLIEEEGMTAGSSRLQAFHDDFRG